jgi:large subunit ribosomal protein L21
MKKAVIQTGGKQYLVSEGDLISVELLKSDAKNATFKPLLIIDENKISVGKPEVEGATVTAEVTVLDKQDAKVTSIRYKAKKRVRKVRGHRQHKAEIKIKKITS